MTHDERVYHHLYVESKSPMENAECIASLEELVEELQAENAKLRSELESVGTAAYLYGRSDLKAENAKLRTEFDKMDKWHSAELQAALAENAMLRELVADMSECMDNSQPHCKQCRFRELDCQWFKFIDRMRELGVGL